MTVSNMRPFTVRTVGKVLRVLVIFLTVWRTSGMQIFSEVNGDSLRGMKGEEVESGSVRPEGNRDQPENPLQSHDETSEEYSGNAIYQTYPGFPRQQAFPVQYQSPPPGQFYHQVVHSWLPQFQQSQLKGDPWTSHQSTPLQRMPWTQWRKYFPYPSYPNLGATHYRTRPDSHDRPGPPVMPSLPLDHQRSVVFEREYSSRKTAVADAVDVLKNLDKLIHGIRPLHQSLPAELRLGLFQQAALLLSRVATVGVALISHRNNSEMDQKLDGFLHKMEDKSYRLKTMLIEMQSLGNENIPVSTPPKTLRLGWLPGPYNWISLIGRNMDTPRPVSG